MENIQRLYFLEPIESFQPWVLEVILNVHIDMRVEGKRESGYMDEENVEGQQQIIYGCDDRGGKQKVDGEALLFIYILLRNHGVS